MGLQSLVSACLGGRWGQEDVTGKERRSLSVPEQLWGRGVAMAGSGGAGQWNRRRVWPYQPNFQFILLPKRVGSWEAAPSTRIQKLGIWNLGLGL